MKITGYKAFNPGLTNQFGMPFEEGKTYTVTGEIKKGRNGNGYHFAANLEDSIHFIIDEDHEEVVVAQVTGEGIIITFETEDGEFSDLYVTSQLTINHILTREEIINHMLERHAVFAQRFIKKFPLTPEERQLFKTQFANDFAFQKAMAYYQEGEKDVYKRAYKSLVKAKK